MSKTVKEQLQVKRRRLIQQLQSNFSQTPLAKSSPSPSIHPSPLTLNLKTFFDFNYPLFFIYLKKNKNWKQNKSGWWCQIVTGNVYVLKQTNDQANSKQAISFPLWAIPLTVSSSWFIITTTTLIIFIVDKQKTKS